MLPWTLFIITLLIAGGLGALLLRATRRLLEFDELFRVIIDPMQEYQDELSKIAKAEGLLTDHPEVIAFHRANVIMLAKIESALKTLKEGRPEQTEVKGLPPQVV